MIFPTKNQTYFSLVRANYVHTPYKLNKKNQYHNWTILYYSASEITNVDKDKANQVLVTLYTLYVNDKSVCYVVVRGLKIGIIGIYRKW